MSETPVIDKDLAAAVLEVEAHAATTGWDQPARLYALVDTAGLIASAPALADSLGLDQDAGVLTPIEQEAVTGSLEDTLDTITWPSGVTGCVAVVERLVLPTSADDSIPSDAAAAEEFAREHPERQEVRIVAAASRAGATYCALRLRSRDDDLSVLTGPDLVPQLTGLLLETLAEEPQA